MNAALELFIGQVSSAQATLSLERASFESLVRKLQVAFDRLQAAKEHEIHIPKPPPAPPPLPPLPPPPGGPQPVLIPATSTPFALPNLPAKSISSRDVSSPSLFSLTENGPGQFYLKCTSSGVGQAGLDNFLPDLDRKTRSFIAKG